MTTIIGTMINHGITLATSGTYASPLTITATGAVDAGTGYAVYGPNTQAWTVDNQGTITAPAGAGVDLNGGGTLTNSGMILGSTTGVLLGAAGMVTNSGTILGTGTAGSGVVLAAGGTVVDSGTISGAGGTAIFFGGTGANRLVLDPGYYLGGMIVGSGSAGATNTLEFGSGASAGIVSAERTTLLANFGTIIVDAGAQWTFSGYNAFGVDVTITDLGSLTNTGMIYGSDISVGAGGAVINFGTILSSNSAFTVYSVGGGSLTNSHGAYIGYGGVDLDGGGTVTNSGMILGSTTGVLLGAAGMVTNSGTILGTGTAGSGVVLAAGGTVVDSGTISGAGGTAISFGGTSGNLLILEHGYSLTGGVSVAGTANTLELLGTAGAVTVDFNKSGGGFTNGTVTFGTASGNIETLKITNSATLPGTISGFTNLGDIVDLTQLSPINASATFLNGQLVVSNGSQTVTLQLDKSENYTGIVWQPEADAGTGTDVAVVCFCRGTLILTDRGEVAVEELAVGDQVKTLWGAFKPIHWIGFGRDLVTGRNRLARPVIVHRGALADNVPRRDLYLTHGHSLYLGGVLIPVEQLINHRSILWDEEARIVEYYHIELEDHDVVLAEGAPAESYYNAGNRALFQNTREGSAAGAAMPTFAPVLNGGEVVEKLWAELFARAGGEIARAATEDPDLHLVVDGRRLDPISSADGVYTFALTAPLAGTPRICSRSAVPSLVGLNRNDHRRLGVAIRQIILRQPGVMTCVDHNGPPFHEGDSHLFEHGHSWTDGEMVLSAALFGHLKGSFTLIVHTRKQAMRYPISAAARAA